MKLELKFDEIIYRKQWLLFWNGLLKKQTYYKGQIIVFTNSTATFWKGYCCFAVQECHGSIIPTQTKKMSLDLKQ
jgi:hypothetical protein